MEENTNSHANAEDFEELGVVYKIPISDLKPHPLNPYHIKNDEATQELIQSIQKNGVLVLMMNKHTVYILLNFCKWKKLKLAVYYFAMSRK